MKPSGRVPVRAEVIYIGQAVKACEAERAGLWEVVAECLAKLNLELAVELDENAGVVKESRSESKGTRKSNSSTPRSSRNSVTKG